MEQLTVDQARNFLKAGPAFIKLADAKLPNFPARRYRDVGEFDRAIINVPSADHAELLGTRDWLDIASEYRAFTDHREVLTCSSYLIEDRNVVAVVTHAPCLIPRGCGPAPVQRSR